MLKYEDFQWNAMYNAEFIETHKNVFKENDNTVRDEDYHLLYQSIRNEVKSGKPDNDSLIILFWLMNQLGVIQSIIMVRDLTQDGLQVTYKRYPFFQEWVATFAPIVREFRCVK